MTFLGAGLDRTFSARDLIDARGEVVVTTVRVTFKLFHLSASPMQLHVWLLLPSVRSRWRGLHLVRCSREILNHDWLARVRVQEHSPPQQRMERWRDTV